MDELWVECRAEGPEEREGAEPVPVRFGRPGGDARAVVEVLDRWHGAGHRYFRVRDDGGALLILRHDTLRDAWQLHSLEVDLDLPAGPEER